MVMTPAVGFFYGGLVKTKNMISVLAQTFAIYAITTLSWTIIGFSFTFGGSNKGFWGDFSYFGLNGVDYNLNPNYGPTISFFLFFFFQTKFAIISPALIIGATAERVRFLPICIFSFLWSLLVYCPIAHWTWNVSGWLYLLGTKDFAGGNAIHIAAGVSAMAAVLVLRDEINYHDDENGQLSNRNREAYINYRSRSSSDIHFAKDIYGTKRKTEEEDSKNSIVFVVIGTMLLWFGWFGFNGGSALIAERSAILAVVNTNIAPCVTLIVWVLLDLIFKERPKVTGMCIGSVAGLVAITPGAGIVRVWAGIIIGLGAAIFPYILTTIRDKYKLFDDRLDVFGCHGVAGIWGGFCVGLFLCDIRNDNTCDPNSLGAIYGNKMQLIYQMFGIVSTVVYSFVVSTIIMYVLKVSMKITVDKKIIEKGLDIGEFKESALMRLRNTYLYGKRNSSGKYKSYIKEIDPDPETVYLRHNHLFNLRLEEKNTYPEEKDIDGLKSK